MKKVMWSDLWNAFGDGKQIQYRRMAQQPVTFKLQEQWVTLSKEDALAHLLRFGFAERALEQLDYRVLVDEVEPRTFIDDAQDTISAYITLGELPKDEADKLIRWFLASAQILLDNHH